MEAQFNNIERPSVPYMDDMLNSPVPVLDKGFVRVVDYMGNDEAIVQAARVSYGQGTVHGSSDEGLIRYLMRRWHTTPFEMCEVKLHVKLPIFVARQWIRHRTANVNEYSARYSILDREFYFPATSDVSYQSTSNNQGREGMLHQTKAQDFVDMLTDGANEAYDNYMRAVTPVAEGGEGIARELARMNLPTNIYTQWYWKVDLHNLLHFLRLRADPHAQMEIRVYADAICKIVEGWVPYAYKAFEDYQLNAQQFSSMEMQALKTLLTSASWTEADQEEWVSDNAGHFGLSKREVNEFIAKIKGDTA